jgi:hypothetical protein
MSDAQFNRDVFARRYANNHLKTDPGIQTVFYLPQNAPDREIRLLEVNGEIVEREGDPLEPLDFGVDTSGINAHTLVVLGITPSQWERIQRQEIQLPTGWTLDSRIPFERGQR